MRTWTPRLATLTVAFAITACSDTPPAPSSYFDEQIGPILQANCVQQTTGCHFLDGYDTAAGNIVMTTYDDLIRRRDALVPYGPYPTSLLLMKAGDPAEIAVETLAGPVTIRTDIRHAAGDSVVLGSSAFALLKRWTQQGAARTGAPVINRPSTDGSCSNGVGRNDRFDPSVPAADSQSFEIFQAVVQPVLRTTCSSQTCHGSAIADMYLSCGENNEELRWNYFIATQYLSAPSATSEILRRPLGLVAGGAFHEGGDIFTGLEDQNYQYIHDWAEDYISRNEGTLHEGDFTPGFEFFVNRVQPMLVRRGCMFLNCHSPSMFHDLRLRGGAGGSFSRIAMERNYEMSRSMLALESPDPNDSRLIAKNLYPSQVVAGAHGLLHRGGALLEEFSTGGGLSPATLAACEGIDADAADLNTIPAYCVLARWHQIEREAAIASGEVFDETIRGVAWVARPPIADTPQEFGTFRGGADLMLADGSVAADGAISVTGERSLNGDCGLGGNADVRNPAVSWDGATIAFAARDSESAPLHIYTMAADGSGCREHPDINAGDTSGNGILVHNFDPAFAPDGRIVFASTRGNLDSSSYDYSGPTLTPAGMLPNANLYVFDASASGGGGIRQLTFLLNQEIAPSFMADGRVIFTSEKRAPGFYQLAGRRMNLDGGDYHPLFGQRNSVGFEQLTEVVELPNRNFAFVASPFGSSSGAGTIGIVNRSIGPDQTDRDPGDRFYLSSFDTPAPGAFGGQRGAFRSPAPVPGGRMLVSCSPDASSLMGGAISFDLCELDPYTGASRAVGGDPGRSDVEAVAIYARPNRGIFTSRPDEANANTYVVPGETDAFVQIHDVPVLDTLLFANTRIGRAIDSAVGGIGVLESLPPMPGTSSFGDEPAFEMDDGLYGTLYVRRRRLGHAGLEDDGSVHIRIPGGTPILFEITNADGDVLQMPSGGSLTGPRVQREEMQFYPGERANAAMRRRLFNGICGGCHGSITGREVDIAVNVDVLTGASRTLSYDQLADFFTPPDSRGDTFGP